MFDDAEVKQAIKGIRNDVPLELNRCVFSDGEVGIVNSADSITIKNCKFMNQQTAYGGTSVKVLKGTAIMDTDTITGSYVGVMLVNGQNPSVECSNSVFRGLEYAAFSAAGSVTADIEDCTIDGFIATDTLGSYGIWFNGNQGTVDGCTIKNVGIDAVYQSGSGGPIIKNCVIDSSDINGIFSKFDTSASTFDADTISNCAVGIYCLAWASPTIKGDSWIHDCTTGIKCAYVSNPTVRSTKITGNGTGVRIEKYSNPDFGEVEGDNCDSGSDRGLNAIHDNTGYEIELDGTITDTISAECNYWGGPPDGEDDFSDSTLVDYNPYLDSDPYSSSPFEEESDDDDDSITRLPSVFDLAQNYPNPFNPVTTIKYQVPRPGSDVEIVVYNVRGQVVRTLVRETQPPGFYVVTWDAKSDRGVEVASGVYFVRMTATGFLQTKKLVVLK
jgi:hypothetical protein